MDNFDYGDDDDYDVAAARRDAHLGAQQASQAAHFHPLHSRSLLQSSFGFGVCLCALKVGKNRWGRGEILPGDSTRPNYLNFDFLLFVARRVNRPGHCSSAIVHWAIRAKAGK